MSKSKAPYLPGTEPATPTDHPPTIETHEATGKVCIVCGYTIGGRQRWQHNDRGYRHADCVMPRDLSSETPATEPEMNEQAEPEDPAPYPERPEEVGRRMDAELKTLGAILRLLGEMPDAARRRVMAYLSSRYPEGRP